MGRLVDNLLRRVLGSKDESISAAGLDRASSEEMIEFAAALRTAANDAGVSPSDMVIMEVIEWFTSAPPDSIRFIRKMPYNIPIARGILPNDELTVDMRRFHREFRNEFMPYELGLSKYEVIGSSGTVPFYCWSGNRDYYLYSSGAFLVAKKNYWRLVRAYHSLKRNIAPAIAPVLPDRTLRDIYNNSVGFLLDGQQQKEQYDKYHIPYKRGLLFAGPPGCGKTMSCKWLRQLCINRKIDTEIVTLDKYKHAAGRGNVLGLFKSDRRRPKILFFDDLDVMVRDRKEGNIEIGNFLTGLDGIETREGIVYVFTTNYMEELDEAFVRPGRIDLFVSFAPPADALRKAFVNKVFDPELREKIDVDDLVKRTDKYSFAELEEVRKLLCFHLLKGQEPNLDHALDEFEKHRKEFQDRSNPYGFNQMAGGEDDEDYCVGDFGPAPWES